MLWHLPPIIEQLSSCVRMHKAQIRIQQCSSTTCVSLTVVSEMAFSVFYAMFSVFLSFPLFQVARRSDDCQDVWGLPIVWAAVGTGLVQVTIGFMIFFWIGVVSLFVGASSPGEIYSIMYGPVIFHYGIMMTGLFWHALVYALMPVEPTSGEVEIDALHAQDEEDVSIAEA